MIPILFSPKAREYNNNGLGVLVDVGYCTVTEERNGSFELKLQYPVNGSHYSDLAVDCQILAKPNETSAPQAFRIYQISKPMNGVVTVRAEHISYELSSVIVSPFEATSIADAFSKIKNNSIAENIFDFWTDKSDDGKITNNVPKSARSLLGDDKMTILDVYGGEYEFDNYVVKLHQNRGADNGVTIAYAKNLTGVKCDERSDGVVTGAIAYWTTETDGIVQTVYGDLQTIDTEMSYSRNVVIDCSLEFDYAPSKSSLNEYAAKYIQENKNVPYFSVSVEFVNLGDTEEYKQYKNLHRVSLCDTVTVKHPIYGIDVKAKVVKTVFDSVGEKYEKIEIGEVSANISQTIVAQEKEIAQKVGFSELNTAVANATGAIAGNKGGYVVLYPNAITPQELLILDKPSVNEATNVWRWNLGGLGHSSTGYNGDFTTAMTADGKIVADFITAGTLDASLITVKNLSADSISSGSLISKDNNSYFSLEDGRIVAGDGNYYTEIWDGHIREYLETSGGLVGGIIPTATEANAYFTIYYNPQENAMSGGISVSYQDGDGGFKNIANFSKDSIDLHPTIQARSEIHAHSGIYLQTNGYMSTYGQSTIYTSDGETSSFHLGLYEINSNDFVRMDFFRPKGEAYVSICGSSLDGNSVPLGLGDKLWWDAPIVIGGGGYYYEDSIATFNGTVSVNGDVWSSADISGESITNRSDKNIKKNIVYTETVDALSLVNSLKIYDYQLKSSGNYVKMGLMADEAPAEILGKDGKSINLYSYCGLLAKAIKELSARLEKMRESV